jgi:TolB-like protein/DNA-binding winged helix-turn-helix (wHTH) protein/Flp pilus assembly protein TadD
MGGIDLRPPGLEVDLKRYQVRRGEEEVRLERQPMELLILLAQRAGELVTRETIVSRLWPDDVFVDTERGINNAIRKIRSALRDDPDNPRYLETIVGKGYRLVGKVVVIAPEGGTEETASGSFPPDPGAGNSLAESVHADPLRPLMVRKSAALRRAAAGIATLLVAAAAWWAWSMVRNTATTPAIRAIAVLPLENLSGSPDQDYFAAGMTDELISDLAKVGSFSVISRTSVTQYKGTKKTLPEIARELNVDAVIEGSVLRDGNRVRITVQLLNKLDRHLWSDSYEGDLHDVLNLQSQVAHAIAQRVESKLNPAQQAQLNIHRPVDPEVLDTYLRGLYQLNLGTPEGMKAALASFQQVIAKDPTFASGYTQIASIDLQLGICCLPPRDIFPQAKANVEKALVLDDTLAEAHAVLAAIHFWYDWDWPGTESEVRRAIELDKNNADAHDQYGVYLTVIGQFDRALPEFQRAHELDPNSVGIMGDLVFWPVMARRYDLAIENGRKAIEMQPRAGWTHTYLGLAYAMKGQSAEGIAEAEAAHRLDDNPLITSFLASIYAHSGRRGEAERTLADLSDQLKNSYSCSYEVAVVHLELGRTEDAFRWFQKAYQQRSGCMVLVKIDPRLDGVRRDSRYQTLLQQVGIP